MDSLAEEWRTIPGFEGMYEVSDQGQVRSIDRTVIDSRGHQRRYRGQSMRQSDHYSGYKLIRLCVDGKYTSTSVHALVAAAFIGPRPGDADVNHIDGHKANNRPSNLEYVSRKGNMEHARRTGLWENRGENNGQATATNDQVRQAIDLVAAGSTLREAADAVGVSRNVVSSAKTGSKWKSLGLPQLKKKSHHFVSDDLRSKAVEVVRSGGGYAEIKQLGTSNGTASRLVAFARATLLECHA